MEINTESLFSNFLNLIGTGMATEKGRKKDLTGGHLSVTNS